MDIVCKAQNKKSDNADQTKDPKIGVNDDMRNLIDTHIKRHRKRRKRGRIESKKGIG